MYGYYREKLHVDHLWELKGWGADLKKAELAIPLYIKSF